MAVLQKSRVQQKARLAVVAPKVGRPAKITLAVIVSVGEKVAKGLTEEQACAVLNVNHNSFNSAKQKPEFAPIYRRAQAVFVDKATDVIAGGVQGWQGLAWLLERRHKAQFSRLELVSPANPLGMGNFYTLSPEDLKLIQVTARREFVPASKERSHPHAKN